MGVNYEVKLMQRTGKSGFTLVELAVVLIIIGIIVTGIVSGKELIRNSKLTAVVTSMQNYLIATNTFREQYDGLPGDIDNATTLWTGVADGNADDQISTYNTEGLEAWKQLAESFNIKGNYTGTTADGDNISLGIDVPLGSFDTTGYWMAYEATASGYAYEDGNYIKYSSPNPAGGTGDLLEASLTPEDARTIDLKMDDGVSSTGLVFSVNGVTAQAAAAASQCFVNIGGVDNYRLTNTLKSCQVWLIVK